MLMSVPFGMGIVVVLPSKSFTFSAVSSSLYLGMTVTGGLQKSIRAEPNTQSSECRVLPNAQRLVEDTTL